MLKTATGTVNTTHSKRLAWALNDDDYRDACDAFLHDKPWAQLIVMELHADVEELIPPTGADFDVRGRVLFCDVCELWLNGPEQYDIHVAGKKHRMVVKNKLKSRSAAGCTCATGCM